MNWEAIGAVGETLGALFVFGSLIYVVLEVRQNSRNILSQSINSHADQMQKFAALQGTPAVMAAMKKIYVDEQTEPDFEDATLLEAYFLSGLSIAQAQYQHQIVGLKDQSDWPPYERLIASFFATEFTRKWWKELGSTVFFDERFVDEVNRIIDMGHDGDFWSRYGKPARDA